MEEIQKLIDQYTIQIEDWKIQRNYLFLNKSYDEESLLQSKSILLWSVIQDLKQVLKHQ